MGSGNREIFNRTTKMGKGKWAIFGGGAETQR